MGVPFKAKNGLDANSNKIVNVSNPTAAQDAATKLYVDNAVGTGLPSQTGNSGKFLTTNATTASWSLVPVAGINATGTPSATTYLRGDGTWATVAAGGVTAVTGTSPVASSGGTTPAISLNSGYGDTQNPYASKTANYVLAAPNGSAGFPTFRAIVAADIPTLNQNTTGNSATATNASAVNGLSKIQMWNNSGQGHTAYQTFLAIPDFGVWFMQNNNAGDAPQSGTQWYTNTVGLGNEYPYSQYALMTAVARDLATKYTWYRTRDAGTWGAWVKGAAGYADTSPASGLTGSTLASGVTASSLTSVGTLGSLTVSGTISGTGAITQAGNQVLHAGNYNSYAPTLTGGNASGSWGISITGSSGSATYAGYLNTTNQGLTGSTGLTTVSSTTAWSNYPIGYSAMFLAGQTATGAPSSNYGFFIKLANRDAGGGWGGIWTDYSGGDTYVGNTTVSTSYATWYKLLSSTNYNSYAPTLTGTGASGSWGISITGNSATTTQLSFSGNTRYMAANQWAGGGGYDGYAFVGGNSRFGFSSTGGYIDVYTDGNFYAGIDLNGLNNLVLHTGNYSSYAIARSGDTVDGFILFRANKGSSSYLANNVNYAVQAYSSDAGAAAMSFHRGGYYAINLGLDPDNVFRLGGWSAPANLLQINMLGDLTMLRYINGTYFNQSSSNSENPTVNQVIVTNSDNYFRKSSTAHFKSQLNLYSGAAGSGVITISQGAPSGGATNDIWLQW